MKDKVCFLLTRSDSIGGAAIHVADLSNDLASRGFEVFVLIGGNGPVIGLFKNEKVTVITIPYLVREVSPFKDILAFFYLSWFIFSFNPSFVSVHTSKVGILGRLICFLFAKKCIYTPHCWSFLQGGRSAFFFLIVEKAMTLLSECIVCVSNDERRAIGQNVFMPRENILVIHNGMKDLENIADFSDQETNFVQISRFEEQKDFVTLVNALARISGSNWKMHIIGDGPLRRIYERKVVLMGLEGKVNFYGQRRDVENFLGKGRVYILCSNWEGLPRSIIEAMRASMPVVATNVGGIPELVDNGATGILFPLKDDLELASSLLRLIKDPQIIPTMGEEGRLRYERYFTYDKMFSKYMALYKDILT